MAAEDDFRDGSGEVSPGFTLSRPGGKHLFEKNAAILFGPSLLFSDSSIRHSLDIETNSIKTSGRNVWDSEDSIPGVTAKPSLSRTSFFTWIKMRKINFSIIDTH